MDEKTRTLVDKTEAWLATPLKVSMEAAQEIDVARHRAYALCRIVREMDAQREAERAAWSEYADARAFDQWADENGSPEDDDASADRLQRARSALLAFGVTLPE